MAEEHNRFDRCRLERPTALSVYKHLRRLDNISAINHRVTSPEVLRCSGGFNVLRGC